MAETVIIDIEAQYRDQTSAGVRGSTDELERMRRKLGETDSGAKKAEASLAKIATTAKTIAKSAVTIPVKIADYATKPLRGLINYATSLKGILTGLVMGKAGQALVMGPTQYADTLKGHELAFENLLGSQEKAAQMIKDIQKFDEKSPFNTMQIIEQSRMLMTYKLADEKNVLSMIENIGDAAMGVGAGDEGIERIVRALGQMKAKGKVSAEEMLQLSEVNISGWQYLADAYGKTTAEIQAMTAKNLIPVEDAITALLAGMNKDFGGMANTNAMKTLKGVGDQIMSILENGPKLQWGLGLREGTMKAMQEASGWLEEAKPAVDALGESLYQLGRDLSTKAADEFIKFGNRVKEVVTSDEFQNAGGWGGKLRFAWGKIIAEPFDEWWSSKGEAFLGDVAGKIGSGLGKFYKGGILTILGINTDAAAEGGLSIGAKFAEGFLEGFDAEKVWDAVKQVFARTLKSAGKVLPGGEKADAGSWLSAAILGIGAGKLIGMGAPLVSGLGGLSGLGGAAAGSGAAMALGKLFTGGALLNGAAGPMTAGALGSIGVAGGAGAIAGGAGLFSALNDFIYAGRSVNRKTSDEAMWSGASKTGMVGLGAAIGTAIAPGIGTAIGAGIGGLGALLAGNTMGKGISDFFDGTGKINKTVEGIQESSRALDQMTEKYTTVTGLLDLYNSSSQKLIRLNEEQAHTGVSKAEEIAKAEKDRVGAVEYLASLYPGLIDAHDLENGRLSEKLGLIREIAKAENERIRRENEILIAEGKAAKPDMEKKIGEAGSNIKDYEAEAEKDKKMADMAIQLAQRWDFLKANQKDLDPDKYAEMKRALVAETDAYERQSGLEYVTSTMKKNSNDSSGLYKAAEHYNKDYAEDLRAVNEEYDNRAKLYDSMASLYQAQANNSVFNTKGLEGIGGMNGVLGKTSEIQATGKQIDELNQKLAGAEKGSQEYNTINKELQTAKTHQESLTREIGLYKDAIQEAVQAMFDLNAAYGSLPSEFKFSVSGSGMSDALTIAQGGTPYKGTDRPRNASGITMWASGTTSAPAGLSWVGEQGPELIRLRGGERIYNNDDSRRIAEQTARSRGGTAAVAAPSIEVNLGGISMEVNGAQGDVMEQLRERMPELGNELSAMIAVNISKIFANMPTRVEGIA